ncbi:protein kinase family protein [Bacillus piscicola]|uniref:protein kinase family protein n=1 Tax=Bacillus piscicola TaxID=1632684 RepID=UPI001F097952
MKGYQELAASVRMKRSASQAVLLEKEESLELIGRGRSAYVFRITNSNKVLKVFFPGLEYMALEEADVYRKLTGLRWFPSLYDAGGNYLVIDFVEGYTLFECLQRGIPVSEENVEEIDRALQMARKKGLNPSDIHLRNIIVTLEGQIKVIDVARYRQSKRCTQWDDLKKAFNHVYKKRYCPRKLPAFLLNFIAVLYKKRWFTTFFTIT